MTKEQQPVSPLIDFCNADSRTQYERGVWWRLHGWRTRGRASAPGLLPESYFINDLDAFSVTSSRPLLVNSMYDTPSVSRLAYFMAVFSLPRRVYFDPT